MKHGERPLALLGCLNRVYNLPSCSGKTMLEDLMLNRAITVERNHASSVIVWNPGQQGAKNMADLGAESWNKFLCIETGNAEPRSISLAPGQTHTLYQKISVRHMEEACPPVKTADNITSQVMFRNIALPPFRNFLCHPCLSGRLQRKKLAQAREKPASCPGKRKKLRGRTSMTPFRG